MAAGKATILSTRPVEEWLISEAASKGVLIEVSPFIDTEPVQSVEIQQEIEQAMTLTATVVFTSMNAVEAVAAQLEGQEPDWTIYCIGNATLRLAEEYFPQAVIAGDAANAADLADLIVDSGEVEEVFFFCGNQRRDELPDILAQNDIVVNEIIVYQTIALPHKLDKAYDGILFFSPSAVDSFFTANKAGQAILFAIGNTTAGAIKKHTANRIVVAEEPVKEALVEQAVGYFI